MGDASRHVAVAVLTDYHNSAAPGVLTVSGTPVGRVSISPPGRRVSLSVQTVDDSPGPDLDSLANVDYNVDHRDGVAWQRLDVTYGDNLTEIYAVFCAILDRVQLEGELFAAAVEAVLVGLGDILTGTDELSHEQQVGLFGELATLGSLAAATSPAAAIGSWRGPAGEEHDFGLESCDLEVKTTTSERRTHWIGSPTQLLPTPGRPLLLLSIQVTGAGTGPGAALPELVDSLRAAAGPHRHRLEVNLQAVGYQDRHAGLYTDRWALRSAPAFHRVDADFPALTPTGLGAATPHAERIVDLRYRIDVDGLNAVADPFPVALILGAPS
jgi:hypothetical protein